MKSLRVLQGCSAYLSLLKEHGWQFDTATSRRTPLQQKTDWAFRHWTSLWFLQTQHTPPRPPMSPPATVVNMMMHQTKP